MDESLYYFLSSETTGFLTSDERFESEWDSFGLPFSFFAFSCLVSVCLGRTLSFGVFATSGFVEGSPWLELLLTLVFGICPGMDFSTLAVLVGGASCCCSAVRLRLIERPGLLPSSNTKSGSCVLNSQ